jgi:uncharacterized protein
MVHKAQTPFHVMTKPIGPRCNLDCHYCFYLRKEGLYPGTKDFRMSPEVLETYIRSYCEAQPGDVISFAWQGGEPTLLGLEYFERIVALQRQYAGGRRVENALQTNGTLLDHDWAVFLRRENFLVGVSLDGPRNLHDTYRLTRGRRPTFDRVMAGIAVLKRHGVEFNTLTVVNRENSRRPLDVYKFLKDAGSGFMQFIPLVESVQGGKPGEVGAASVRPERWGEFLIAIFDAWLAADIGRVHVQTFEVALSQWMGFVPSLCVFGETCGKALALEHNGDVYACDHYVDPGHLIGNLMRTPLNELVDSEAMRRFGDAKRDTLPAQCRRCPVLFACRGECPKNRIALSEDGEPGLNYLCAGYRAFFEHADPALETLSRLLRAGYPARDLRRVPRDQWKGRLGPRAATVGGCGA